MNRHLARLGVASLIGFSSACGPAKASHDDNGGYPTLDSVPSSTAEEAAALSNGNALRTVFVIVMENKSWSSIKGSPSAPYINGVLLAEGAHAERYTSHLRPSEPNYIWLEAGSNLGIEDNDPPAVNYRTTPVHLTRQLEIAGISWKSYQEGISGLDCPLVATGKYAPKHNPMIFFDDVTEGRNPASPKCIAHMRPYTELQADLEKGNVARYNFITPDSCNSMHDASNCASGDSIANGDRWLSTEVPKILASRAYKEGGALFVAWDEDASKDALEPIGFLALSPLAKRGYAGNVAYDHSSLVRTIQDVFGVRPYLRDAAKAEGVADLFTQYP